MESEGSLPCSLEYAVVPYLKSGASRLRTGGALSPFSLYAIMDWCLGKNLLQQRRFWLESGYRTKKRQSWKY